MTYIILGLGSLAVVSVLALYCALVYAVTELEKDL